VVANQYGASSITTVAAALGVVPVALAIFAPLRPRRLRSAMRTAG
jgi:hypothetical protein